MRSNDEFFEDLEQYYYDTALFFERYLMNRDRRKRGLPPFRRTA